jgi:hypothetical protein
MQISITRALGELKLLAKTIHSTTAELKALDLTQNKFKGKALVSGKTIEQFEKEAVSKYQSIVDQISRRDAIKKAIVESNAKTLVTIGSTEMTVASAIEFKNSIIHKKTLLDLLRRQNVDFTNRVTQERLKLDEQVAKLIEQNTGKDRKVDREDYEKIAAPFIDNNQINLLDPLKLSEKIEVLQKEIVEFESNVDIVLSESNSKTMIEV